MKEFRPYGDSFKSAIVSAVHGVSTSMVVFFALVLLDEIYRVRIPAIFEFNGAVVVSAAAGLTCFLTMLLRSTLRHAADSNSPRLELATHSLFWPGFVLVMANDRMSTWSTFGYFLIFAGTVWSAISFFNSRAPRFD